MTTENNRDEPIIFERRKDQWKISLVCLIIDAVLIGLLLVFKDEPEVKRFGLFIFLILLSATIGCIYFFASWLNILSRHDTVKFYQSHAEIKKGTKGISVPYASFDYSNWVFLNVPQSSSGSPWSEGYRDLKDKGLCLQFEDIIICLEKLQKGVYEVLQEKLGDLAPVTALYARKNEIGTELIFLNIFFPNIVHYLGKDASDKWTVFDEGVHKPFATFRTSSDGNVYMSFIAPCDAEGVDNVTKTPFKITEQGVNEIPTPEYEVSDSTITIKDMRFIPKKLQKMVAERSS